MSDRIKCDLPDCQRTIGADRYRKLFGHEPGGWICTVHWAMVPKRLKRIKARHERQRRKFGDIVRGAAYERLWRAIWRCFE